MIILDSSATISGVPEPFAVTLDWHDHHPLYDLDTYWEFMRSDKRTTVYRGKLNGIILADILGRIPFKAGSYLQEGLLEPFEVHAMMFRTRVSLDWSEQTLALKAVSDSEYFQEFYSSLDILIRPVLGRSELRWPDGRRASVSDCFISRADKSATGVLDFGGAATALSYRDHCVQLRYSRDCDDEESLGNWAAAVKAVGLTRRQEETLMALSLEWSGTAEDLLQAARPHRHRGVLYGASSLPPLAFLSYRCSSLHP